jgi:protein-disulfide isomerase
VANKPKRYDLKAADRKRDVWVRVGLTAVVILFAVGLLLFIMKPWQPKPTDDSKQTVEGPPAGAVQSINVSVPDKLIKDPAGKPKAVLSLYEDFLCPACGNFEKRYASTISQLINSGAVQADYYMLGFLDVPGRTYSSRAASAGYCVAEGDTSPDKKMFQAFHAQLYANQPSEGQRSFPTNAQLLDTARSVGATSQAVADCIKGNKYMGMAKGMMGAVNVKSTPTVRINGQSYETSQAPQALVDQVKKIVGDVPGLAAPAS